MFRLLGYPACAFFIPSAVKLHGKKLETVTPQEVKAFVTSASIPNYHRTTGVSNQVSITLTSKYCGTYRFYLYY